MSETPKPAISLSAAHKVLACIKSYNPDAAIQCILPPAEVLADVISGDFGPMVEALMKLAGAVDGLFVGYPYLTECKKQAVAVLAALEAK